MKSWEIKDDNVCTELLALMGITNSETQILQALQPEAKKVSASMAAEFHGRLTSHDNTKEFFANADVAHVSSLVARWFEELFSGEYDAAYAKKRILIGQTHVRIGLPVRYPLAMLDIVTTWGAKVTATASDPVQADTAFKKVLALDVAIFSQAYEDNQLKHLSELVGGEPLARRLLAGLK